MEDDDERMQLAVAIGVWRRLKGRRVVVIWMRIGG